jgi:signal transduction histidine kinase
VFDAGAILVLFAAYYATGRLGLWLDAESGFASLVWAPSGISLVALLIFGYRLWPGIALGAFLVNTTVGAPFAVACEISVGNTLEAVLGVYLLRRVARFERLERLRDVAALTFLAALVSTLVSATIGVASLWAGGLLAATARATWIAWWIGDALGDLLVAPLLLTIIRRPQLSLGRRKWLEATVLFALLVAFSLAVFTRMGDLSIEWFQEPYILFPLLIWAAVRFGPYGASLGSFLISVIAVLGAVLGLGPFVKPTVSESLLFLQTFMGIVAVTMLTLATAISERNKAIAVREQFLSIASHELRTPLSALSLHFQTLLRGVQRGDALAGPKAAGKLEKADRQVARLTRLVNELLDDSTIHAGKMQLHVDEFELSAMVREVAARFEEELTSSGTPLTIHSDEAIVGQWDRKRLEQVVGNLLSNAIKYGPGKPIEVSLTGAPDRARIAIRDQGPGIAPEHQRRIFERFERAVSNRHFAGFGLGLWIAREIVDAHRGAISVNSEPGNGATFTVELPVHPTASNPQ